ncbi:MAG TPA: class I SAM-dependent methyltransferase [Pyrinomonadaceae bacterium]|nr:class I SAM-dependent methyltransferase [Pyrinomonadaceae bacterium]
MGGMNNGRGPRRCPACGSDAAGGVGEKDRFAMSRCRACGTLYVAELPGAGELEDYDSYYGEENLAVPEFINRRLDEIIAGFEPYKHTGRLLDVGCGAGTFMQAARRAAWDAVGVEVSATAAEHNRAKGFEVFNGELADARYPEGRFDVVVLSEVLEHVEEPRAMLGEVLRIMRPGGLLWATTPNGRGFSARALGLKWSAVSPPEHLHLFSRGAVESLLVGVGFVRARVVTEGFNPFEIVGALRGRPAPSVHAASNARVQSAYELNAFLTEGGARRAVKGFANGVLRLCRLGDSLKIRAEKKEE